MSLTLLSQICIGISHLQKRLRFGTRAQRWIWEKKLRRVEKNCFISDFYSLKQFTEHLRLQRCIYVDIPCTHIILWRWCVFLSRECRNLLPTHSVHPLLTCVWAFYFPFSFFLSSSFVSLLTLFVKAYVICTYTLDGLSNSIENLVNRFFSGNCEVIRIGKLIFSNINLKSLYLGLLNRLLKITWFCVCEGFRIYVPIAQGRLLVSQLSYAKPNYK